MKKKIIGLLMALVFVLALSSTAYSSNDPLCPKEPGPIEPISAPICFICECEEPCE